MFTFSVDLGQVIISFLIGISGYFVKRTLDKLEGRLDKHDELILDLVSKVSILIGRNK